MGVRLPSLYDRVVVCGLHYGTVVGMSDAWLRVQMDEDEPGVPPAYITRDMVVCV